MKNSLLLLTLISASFTMSAAGSELRKTINLDGAWKFKKTVFEKKAKAAGPVAGEPLEGTWVRGMKVITDPKDGSGPYAERILRDNNHNWASYKVGKSDWQQYEALKFKVYTAKKLQGYFMIRCDVKSNLKWSWFSWTIPFKGKGWQNYELKFDDAVANSNVKKHGWKDIGNVVFFTPGTRNGDKKNNPLRREISLNEKITIKIADLKLVPARRMRKIANEGIGLEQKWFAPDYNDSSWKDKTIPDDGRTKKQAVLNEIDWLRKKFTVPSIPKDKRVYLCFAKLPYVSWVWVNGKLLSGKYPADAKYSPATYQGFSAGFEYDIIDLIHPGKENVIAIRLFPWGGYIGFHNNNIDDINIKILPDTNIENMLIRPDIDKKQIHLEVTIRNQSKHSFKGFLRYAIYPYKKERELYNRAGSVYLPANRTKSFKFVLPYKGKMSLWSPENPSLYNLRLELINNKNTLMDTLADTFGFRKFEVRGRRFYLNNKPVFLMGESFVTGVPWKKYDPRDFSELKRLNFNIIRTHCRTVQNRHLLDADKTGMMIIQETGQYHAKGEKELKEYYRALRREIPRKMRKLYNHPSLVIWCMHNEPFYHPVELISSLYEEAKKTDPYRPVMTAAGGPHIGFSHKTVPDLDKFKTDIVSCHAYCGWYADSLISIQDNIDDRVKLYPKKPLIYDENTGHYLVGDVRMRHMNHTESGNFRRYAINQRIIDEVKAKKYPAMLNEHAWKRRLLAVKTMIEFFRMNKGKVAGSFIYTNTLHSYRKIMEQGKPEICVHFFEVIKQLMAQKFVCAKVIELNHFTNSTYKFPLYAMNDSQEAMRSVAVQVQVVDPSKNIRMESCYNFGNLAPDENKTQQATVKFGNWPTGMYSILLTMKEGGKVVAKNSYEIRLMSSDILKRKIKTGKRICLLDDPKSQTAEMLTWLGLTYKLVSNLKMIDWKDCQVLIIGAAFSRKLPSDQAQKVSEWVKSGGKIIAFEQLKENATENIFAVCPFFPVSYEKKHRNSFVDFSANFHPACKGLDDLMFQRWNGNEHHIVEGFFTPDHDLDKFTLASVRSGSQNWMKLPQAPVVLDIKYGKGQYFITQLFAVSRYGNDPVATTYLQNVLDYVLNQNCIAPEYVRKKKIGPGPFALEKDGIIRHWLICGPFPLPGGRPHFSRAQALSNVSKYDKDFLVLKSGTDCIDNTTSKNIKPNTNIKHPVTFPVTKERYWNIDKPLKIVNKWRRIQSPDGMIRLSKYFIHRQGKVTLLDKNVVAYGACYIYSPKEMDITIKIGSDDGFQLWVNHKEIGKLITFRSLKKDMETYKVKLNKGENLLLLKIYQDVGDYGFCVRLRDADGKPLSNVKIWLSPK